jgi:hemoglobin
MNRHLLLCLIILFSGCAAQDRTKEDFFTSGSRAADQRAEQRVAKDEQLKNGTHSGTTGEKDQAEQKKSLYERLGGEKGVQAIVDDFVTRALADPRVNWERKGVKRGGFLGYGMKSAEWKPDPGSIDAMKKHIVQFVAIATGGPTKYDGKEMGQVHKGMNITNAEFDAAIGDLKASLDKLGVAVDEQKELLAIVESTRPQIVEQR